MDIRPLHSEAEYDARASEILSRKRPLTTEMAWKLNREWGIAAESLIRPTDA